VSIFIAVSIGAACILEESCIVAVVSVVLAALSVLDGQPVNTTDENITKQIIAIAGRDFLLSMWFDFLDYKEMNNYIKCNFKYEFYHIYN
jgi:hypothetical protein